jgi:hypothetical protein
MPKKSEDPPPADERTPARRGRFKPGQSGNLRGRPKKRSPSIKNDLFRILQEKIDVIKGGRREQMTRGEAMLLAVSSKAINGDIRAVNAMLTPILKMEPEEAEQSAPDAVLSVGDEEIIADFLRRNGSSK